MKFDPPLQRATLIKRYKRFLTDVILESGEETTIHCPNTGSMKNCLAEGSPCWYSTSDNPKRKYPFTWEIGTTPAGDLAGINTGRANALVVEAIKHGVVTELTGYGSLRTEVRYGEERSRIDILLEGRAGHSDEQCFVEVKSVTLRDDVAKGSEQEGSERGGSEQEGTDSDKGGRGLFPDSVSTRGSKHLRELMLMKEQGHRAVLFFCVQHSGIGTVSPADEIDPEYGKTLRQAMAAGVEVLAYRAKISADEIVLTQALPVWVSPIEAP